MFVVPKDPEEVARKVAPALHQGRRVKVKEKAVAAG